MKMLTKERIEQAIDVLEKSIETWGKHNEGYLDNPKAMAHIEKRITCFKTAITCMRESIAIIDKEATS